MTRLRIGLVDTGVNAWHSHVRGSVAGCRIHLRPDGTIAEDDDFRDPIGHGTAVAAIIRAALPDAEIFAVRVFDDEAITYPSLVARGILRAATRGCAFVNLSLAIPPGPGDAAIAAACVAAIASGCTLVASAHQDRCDWLPASLPGVFSVSADDAVAEGELRSLGRGRFAAPGRPRDLPLAPGESNFAGPSFACARGLVQLARERVATAT
jgi:subtilisin family serine protease